MSLEHSIEFLEKEKIESNKKYEELKKLIDEEQKKILLIESLILQKKKERENKFRNILKSAMIVGTPINKDISSKSNIDYVEQLERKSKGLQIMWDDSPTNKQHEGGVFCFIKNNKNVTVHIITKVLPKEDRLPSWSTNVGQGDRQVLYLSEESREIDWSKWIELDGCKKSQGTQRIKKGSEKIIDYLNQLHI